MPEDVSIQGTSPSSERQKFQQLLKNIPNFKSSMCKFSLSASTVSSSTKCGMTMSSPR
jgi:hypothetical protein